MERHDLPFRSASLVALAAATVLGSAAALAAPKGSAAPAPVAAAPDADGGEDAPALAPAKGRHGTVTLNFVNADIEAVSRAIGTMLGREMLVDPRVKGTITVYSDKAQPVWQAYRTFLASLRGLGFTVVDSNGMLKVVPEADAKLQSSVVSVGKTTQTGDQVLTQIFRLNYENPNNLVAVLRPLITANNTINASPGNNSLIITDYADNLQRLGKIIAALDQPTGADVEIIPLKHALASDLVQVAQRLIETGGAGQPGIPGQGGATSILAEPRSNSIIIRATNGARMATARAIIEKLDRPVEGGGPAGNIWVVYLKNSDATRMAELLRAAVAGGQAGSGGGSSSSSGGGGLSSTPGAYGAPGATPNQPGGGANASGNAAGQSAAATTPVSAAARPSTGGQIQADPATNSLIISAPEPLYRQLRKVIDQLDVRRQQIYVETLIVKVDANKAAEMGIQWQGLFGTNNNNAFVGGGTNFNNPGNANIVNLALAAGSASGGTSTTGTTGTTASISLPGLNVGYVPKINGIYTLAALAHFLETKVGGNVLSTPNLISLDNEEAKIVVGSNIGIPTGSYTATTTGTVNPFQTFDRKDVGITLRIKSQIGEGGTVRMTIFQENSSIGAQTPYGPNTDKSSIETNVVVDDGQLMVLGGLIKDEYTDEVDGVPLLSSIPVIGNLFKTQTRTRNKSNLMVFLRPIVIRTQADADRLSVSRYDLIRAEQQEKQPDSNWVLPINEAPIIPPISPNGRFDKQAPVAPSGDVK